MKWSRHPGKVRNKLLTFQISSVRLCYFLNSSWFFLVEPLNMLFVHKRWGRTCFRKDCTKCFLRRLVPPSPQPRPPVMGSWTTPGSTAGLGPWWTRDFSSLGWAAAFVFTHSDLNICKLQFRFFFAGGPSLQCVGVHAHHSEPRMCELWLLCLHDDSSMVQLIRESASDTLSFPVLQRGS